ncbi:TetR/AcrR family transcriptional regulator [Pseudovibrio sp. Ad26]|uniref:TetR/AcrR family transcriptional regulator n=1 Tax=Pseudovibrio sp. Ad26 TaxID=989410 RepID=UPI0007B25285|nr:TetR/AcrR family transcriptional regulator [Pseudovibrio sp. Ad26]KZL05817.1 Bacterial regulatory protein, tetR family [Pseudovibrio sp. Ad26]
MTSNKNPDDLIPPHKLEEVFKIAFQLLLEKGRQAASINAVAKEANIHPDLLHQRFEGERDLIAPAMRWYFMRFSQQVSSSSAMYADIYSCMYLMLTDFAELCEEQNRTEGSLYWSTIGEIGRLDPELGQEYLALRLQWAAEIRRRLVKFENDLQAPEDIDHLVDYFMMAFEGIIQMVKFETPLDQIFPAIDITMEALSTRMKKSPNLPGLK